MVGVKLGWTAMPARLLLLVLVPMAIALVGCGGTETVTETVTNTATETTTVLSGEPSGLAAPRQRVQFGHIRALKRVGDRYELAFDPALLLTGETANRAAAEDGVVEVGEPVPNDNYVVDESKRTYIYLVADDVKVTLLVRSSPEDWAPTSESLAALAEVVAGTSELDLFEPLDTGVWITVDIDTVTAVYQQYVP
jgi:hypothetical protein